MLLVVMDVANVLSKDCRCILRNHTFSFLLILSVSASFYTLMCPGFEYPSTQGFLVNFCMKRLITNTCFLLFK